jgi:hypothetical protein
MPDALCTITEADRLCANHTHAALVPAAESKRTLQDKPKSLHYEENAARFERFAAKIIHFPMGIDPEEKVLLCL